MKNKLKESRMIKNILKLGFIITGCFILASFSPSLDGRAVVVEPGVFPEGLFAKTVGYLPGDIISVTNITGDATIDILVIGALDPSEGVAIMLSPEAAAAIGINKNSNNIVKITKRSNQDERVYGSAVIASNGSDTSSVKEPEPVVQPVKEAEPVVQTPVEESKPVTQPQPLVEEEVWEEPVTDEKETVAATQPEEEIYSKPIEEPADKSPVTEYEYFDDEALPEYFEDDFEEEKEAEYIEETPVYEQPVESVEDRAPAQEEPVIYEEFKDDELDQLPDEEEEFETIPAESQEEAFEEEPVEEEAAEEEFTEEEPEEMQEPEEEFFDDEGLSDLEEENEAEEEAVEEAEEEEPEFEEEEFEEEEIAEEEVPEDEFIEEEPIDELVEEEIVEEPVEEAPVEDEIAEEEEEVPEEDWSDEPEVLDEEEYDAIVLVPADDNPPVYDRSYNDQAPIIDNTVINEGLETIPPVIDIDNQVIVQPSSSGNETSYDKFVVESLDELEADKYYIQIATLKDDENILEIVNKYGSKYPITIVPTAKGTKQVLVGPVTLDEYGTVLARFKAYGYKDAFLRKGTNPNPKAKGSAIPDAK